jgi:hypothetical protein
VLSFLCKGLPELGSDPDAQMLTARQQPQHLTYSAAFVRELHAFVSEQLVEAMVRRSAFAGSCWFCTAAALVVPNVVGIQLLHCSYFDRSHTCLADAVAGTGVVPDPRHPLRLTMRWAQLHAPTNQLLIPAEVAGAAGAAAGHARRCIGGAAGRADGDDVLGAAGVPGAVCRAPQRQAHRPGCVGHMLHLETS